MSSTMMSRRLLGCLFLILMSRYGDAYKPTTNNYLEAILMTLERIENGILKLAEQSALNCATVLSRTEKQTGLTLDHPKNLDDDESARSWNPHTQSTNLANVRRSMSRSDEDDDYQAIPRKPKRNRSSSRNRNQNVNSNSNINTNVNSNSNRAKIFDLSDEVTA